MWPCPVVLNFGNKFIQFRARLIMSSRQNGVIRRDIILLCPYRSNLINLATPDLVNKLTTRLLVMTLIEFASSKRSEEEH